MCRRIERYEKDRSILKCEYIRCSPPTLNNVKNPIQQSLIDIPKEDSVQGLKVGYFEKKFDAKEITGDNCANNSDICWGNLGPIASFSELKFTTISKNF